MKRSPRPIRFLEYLWLIIAGISLFAAIQNTIQFSFTDSNTILLFIIFLVSILMFFLRRHMRKKISKSDNS